LYLLRTIPGVGQILALVILYGVCDIKRFGTVQRFCSYARLIRPEKSPTVNGQVNPTKRSETPI
jgi:transposase